MARAGRPLGLYGEMVGGELHHVANEDGEWTATRSPYRAYRLTSQYTSRPVHAFVRDPNSSAQVWSKYHGYPGNGAYLEFHKIRWPGGLKLWRVTGRNVDLGGKEPYDPDAALAALNGIVAIRRGGAEAKSRVDAEFLGAVGRPRDYILRRWAEDQWPEAAARSRSPVGCGHANVHSDSDLDAVCAGRAGNGQTNDCGECQDAHRNLLHSAAWVFLDVGNLHIGGQIAVPESFPFLGASGGGCRGQRETRVKTTTFRGTDCRDLSIWAEAVP